MEKKFLFMIICLWFLVSLVAPCQASSNKSERYGGTLVYSNANEYPIHDPQRYKGSSPREMMAPVYSTLYQYNVKGEVVNDLAVGMEVVEPTVIKVQLRQDVKFHNGKPLTAKDVVYSYKRILNPDTGASSRSQLQVLQDIVAQDNYTVLFKFKKPVPPEWFKEVAAQVESAILSEEWMNAEKRDFTKHMGSGPFMWDKFVYGVKVVLKRNPHYYRKDEFGNQLPYLDRIEFVGYSDPALRIAAIQAGDVDMDAFIPWERLQEFIDNPKINVDLSKQAFMDLTFNVGAKPFDNKLVRQAMAYAINRKQIKELAFYGFAEEIYGGILAYQPWSWAYNPKTKNRFEYNPEKAKKLLAQAGYPNGFKVSILTSADDQMHIDTSTVIAESLKAIGVEVELRLEEWGRRVASGNKGDYTFAISGTSPKMIDPDWLASFFHGDLGGYYHRPANWNFPAMDALLDEARVTLNQEKRKELYHKWEELFLDECPEVFLVYRETGGVRQDRVKGFKFFPGFLRTSSTEGLETAWIAKPSK